MSQEQVTKKQYQAARRVFRRKPENLAASLQRQFGLGQSRATFVAREILEGADAVVLYVQARRGLKTA